MAKKRQFKKNHSSIMVRTVYDPNKETATIKICIQNYVLKAQNNARKGEEKTK
jgi:hypothetical protein